MGYLILKKTKIIGNEFIRIFENEVKKLNKEIPFLAQGTLYPDIIESAKFGVSATAKPLKLTTMLVVYPKIWILKSLSSLKMLFKDEVRSVGLSLGLSEEIVYRQPFPGPDSFEY